MLGLRAVFGLFFLQILFFTPALCAIIAWPESCAWCADTDNTVSKLQKQIEKLRALWAQNFQGDSLYSDPEDEEDYNDDEDEDEDDESDHSEDESQSAAWFPTSAPRASPTLVSVDHSHPQDSAPPSQDQHNQPANPEPSQNQHNQPANTEPSQPLQDHHQNSQTVSQPTDSMGGGNGYKSVAYFVNWGIYGRKYFPQNIPADKLTHVLYSFGDNRPDGEVFLTDEWSDIQIHYEGDSWNDQGTDNLYGNLKQLYLLKQKNRNLKILLSIGGWTYAHEQKHFDAPAATAEGRKKFADSCVTLIKNLGFDGIDIDWEYPQNQEQGQQLFLLLQEIRNAMDQYAQQLEQKTGHRPHFALTIAAPAGESNYKNMPMGQLAQVLDFINLMAYDYSGSWDQAAGHQANLYASSSCPACTPFNTNSVIEAYTAQGVPSDKIVLGMPLYGRSFTNTDGLGKPFQGTGQGSWEQGVWDFKALPQAGAQEHIDDEAGASYSYDPSSRTLISYDTVDMALKKTQWIKQRNLGGAMWWELSGDRQDAGSIISNVVAELAGPDNGKMERQTNWLAYPDSKYDNLRAGFPNK